MGVLLDDRATVTFGCDGACTGIVHANGYVLWEPEKAGGSMAIHSMYKVCVAPLQPVVYSALLQIPAAGSALSSKLSRQRLRSWSDIEWPLV